MTRRAFTLLETVLAVTLGSLVLVACLAVMSMIATAERQLAASHREAVELANTQLVMRRTFQSLRMDGDAPTLPELTQRPDDPPQESEEPIVARIDLQIDERPSLTEAFRFAGPGAISVANPPQFLEVVLSPTPVPPRGGANPDDGVAVRGRFDLRPDGYRERQLQRAEAELGLRPPLDENESPERPGTWSLWWTPIAGVGVVAPTPALLETPEDAVSELELAEARAYATHDVSPDATRLLSGIATLEFRMFRSREMQTTMFAAAEGDIPAYAALTITTATGRRVEWLFEIGWSTGDDPANPVDLDLALEGTNGNAGDGDGDANGGPNGNAGSGRGGAFIQRRGGGGGRGGRGGRGGGGR